MGSRPRTSILDPASKRMNRIAKKKRRESIEIIERKCPHCGHHKAFSKLARGVFCCRCRREIK